MRAFRTTRAAQTMTLATIATIDNRITPGWEGQEQVVGLCLGIVEHFSGAVATGYLSTLNK